ncbi:MAG: hypothetical protein IJ088_16570 [Clostridia bacterium]|nr:hypothetical protein [Clostridia bacterium]
MSGEIYRQLSREGRVLVDEAIAHLAAGYDRETGLVTETLEGKPYRSVRNSMYYALGVMIRGDADALPIAQKVIRTVLDLQLDAPQEIWHGVFRHPDDPNPPAGLFNWHEVSREERYHADVTWERVSDRFGRLLEERPDLDRQAILDLLESALRQTVPVEWDTYEPNLREFIGMTFAMMLEHFEQELPGELVREMEESGEKLVTGAIERMEAGLIPLNTNVRIMYVFILEWFGRRLDKGRWVMRAIKEARQLYEEYAEYHACAEFNSPTYCGVDLSTLGFWRRYSQMESIRTLGERLETGIWEDMVAFYNPAMRNFSGPYSRCYELDMKVHTCFYDLLYWGLGEERFPFHPFSIESVINPLMVLGEVHIPESVIPRLLEVGPERSVERKFRELSERGEPGRNNALCTARAWISPDLMIGAMSGSRNTSYQLHPLTAFWMDHGEMGTLTLQRRCLNGRAKHMHTVIFDGTVSGHHAEMRVRNEASAPVELVFLVDRKGTNIAGVTDTVWHLPGLTVQAVVSDTDNNRVAPNVHKNPVSGQMEICYPLEPGDERNFELDFDLQG